MADDEKDGSGERGRVERVREQARDLVDRTRESVRTGASGLAEQTRQVTERASAGLGQAAHIVREAERDDELGRSVADATERGVHRAGATLNRAAPAIGRGAEKLADGAGTVLHYAAGPIAKVLGAIAATVGGWWHQASAERHSLSEAEDEVFRAHFAALTVVPADLPYERARTGYALGYVAAANPEYLGRSFEEVESDLRSGFQSTDEEEYDRLRDFARFGYDRSMG